VLLETALSNNNSTSTTTSASGPQAIAVPLTANPSPRSVSLHCKLNAKQDMAFRIAATALIDRCVGRPSPNEEPLGYKRNFTGKTLRIILTGMGGTGKSHVVNALKHFASLWGHPNAVVTVASTGIAAVMIAGKTIHSYLAIPVEGKAGAVNRDMRCARSFAHHRRILLHLTQAFRLDQREAQQRQGRNQCRFLLWQLERGPCWRPAATSPRWLSVALRQVAQQ